MFPPLTLWKRRVDYTHQLVSLSGQEADETCLSPELLLMDRSSGLCPSWPGGRSITGCQEQRFTWFKVAWNELGDMVGPQGVEGKTRQCHQWPWAPPCVCTGARKVDQMEGGLDLSRKC